ncbi:MAG: hypothetical protein AB1791_00225 [Chloroflexota bacterium]
MIEFVTRSAGGKTFTLSINGEHRSYTNDKEGKRQAILDGLKAIAPVPIGQDVYLPSNQALQVVAVVMYPDGIQTEAAYQSVCQVTEKACAHLGYGEETQLGPPHVPVTARGLHRRQQRPVDAQLMLDELNVAGMNSYVPRQEVNGRVLWNKAAWDIYNQAWSSLTAGQQSQIQTQVDAIVTQADWQTEKTDQATVYCRPLPADLEGAIDRLQQYLDGSRGQPVPVHHVVMQAQLGAYGRAFYTDELAPELAAAVYRALQATGYCTEPEDGEYRPRPLLIPSDSEPDVTAALSALTPTVTTFGPALMLPDVLATVRTITQTETIGDWQAQQLVRTGVVGRALRKLGYDTEITWLQPYHFTPPLGDDRAHPALLKEVRVQRDPDKYLTLAKGLAVYTPALVIDGVDNTLVYLEMIGPKQSVKANWAALVGGDKSHWLGRQRVVLDGMKAHLLIQSALPCGWSDAILIHKQASLKEMNPEQPFYLLDDGTQPIPPLFYPLLNKSLALPLLACWSEYLWECGRERNLVTLLNQGEGQGYAAWRVAPAPEAWQEVVQEGLQNKLLSF